MYPFTPGRQRDVDLPILKRFARAPAPVLIGVIVFHTADRAGDWSANPAWTSRGEFEVVSFVTAGRVGERAPFTAVTQLSGITCTLYTPALLGVSLNGISCNAKTGAYAMRTSHRCVGHVSHAVHGE